MSPTPGVALRVSAIFPMTLGKKWEFPGSLHRWDRYVAYKWYCKWCIYTAKLGEFLYHRSLPPIKETINN